MLVHPHDIFSSSEPWTIRIKKFAEAFVAEGHTVTVCYFPLDHRTAYTERLHNGYTVVPLDRRVGWWHLIRNTRELMKRSASADLIHFQKYYYYASIPCLIAGMLTGKPLHYDWDDWETKIFYYSNPTKKWIGKFIHCMEMTLPQVVDSVSVSGAHLRQICIDRGVPPARITHAPVGADLEHFRPDKKADGRIKAQYGIEGSFVLYVGQLHGGQYAELFVHAAEQICRVRNDVTFMIVGDGYRRPELERLADDLHLTGRVIFTGMVPHEEVPYYIADADVCAACFEDNDITRSKSPLKIAEYMASGKAIVASAVGEVRTMLGGFGILTAPGDPKALAGGITLLLDNAELRSRLSQWTRIRAVKRYNWTVTAQALLPVYMNGTIKTKKKVFSWKRQKADG